MKKIGLLIQYSKSIFTNGCLQQGYFLLKCFRNKGYEANFITVEKEFTKFEVINEDIHRIVSTEDLDQYSLIVFSSGSITNDSYLSYCKAKGIKIANSCVGNYYIINQEEIVFDAHKKNEVIKRMFNIYVDQIWLMPMYTHNLNYTKYISKVDTKISPYVWDSTIIDLYNVQNNINTKYNPLSEKLDIVIMEPNISIHKTSLVPLLIAEEFYSRNPDKLGQIYLISSPDDIDQKLSHLNIFKNLRVQKLDRIKSMEFYSILNNMNSKYVVLSSNIRNGLNFLHLECFKLGIPIIHNCKPFNTSGLYYREDDIMDDYETAIEHLNNVHSGNYVQNIDDILHKYSPKNIENINGYDTLIKNLLDNSFSILDNLVSNINSNNEAVYLDKLAVVLSFKDKTHLSILNNNLKFINKLSIKNDIFILNHSNYTLNLSNWNAKEVINLDENDYDFVYICKNILYKKILYINNLTLVNFDMMQIFDKENAFLDWQKDKELVEFEYKYIYNITNMIKNCIKKYDSVKIIGNDFYYIKHNYNLKKIIENFNKDNVDELYILNIIVNFLFDKINTLDIQKNLILSQDKEIIGYSYNKDNNQILNVYKKITKKNKSLINDSRIHMIRCHQY